MRESANMGCQDKGEEQHPGDSRTQLEEDS